MATAPDFGLPTPIPFAYFDRDSCSWRMCQGSLLEVSGECCTTWPKQGTWDLGFAYELPISEPLTAESESSSSPAEQNLPTPTARDGKGPGLRTGIRSSGRVRTERDYDLALVASLLPTPVAGDSLGARNRTSGRQEDSKHHDGVTLTDAIWTLEGRTTDRSGNPLPASGGSTKPRSGAGKQSSAETLPDQLIIEDG